VTCHIPYNKFCIALLPLLLALAPQAGYGQFPTLTAYIGSLTIGAGATMTVKGDFNIQAGAIVSNAGTIALDGSWSNLGDFSDRTGIVIIQGGSHCITGYTIFNNLEIDCTGLVDIDPGGNQEVWNKLTLTNGLFDVRGDDLVLLSDATGTARVDVVTGGNMKGDFTVQRYIDQAEGWRLLGAPVNDSATIEGWNDDFAMSGFPGTDDPASSFTSMWTYDETDPGPSTNGFEEPSNTTDVMGIGQGFLAYVSDGLGVDLNKTIDLTDSLVSGQQVVNVTFTDDGVEDVIEHGWNLIANPYPSDILWNDVTLSTSVSPIIYLYDPDQQQYVDFDYADNRVIPSHQAFWVKAIGPAAVTTVTFDETNKTADVNNFLKVANTNEIGMTLSGYGSFNSSRIRFNGDASVNYDPMLDAFKLGSFNPDYASLSSVTSEGYDMATNAVPDDYENFAIPLRVFWTEYQPAIPDFNLTLSIDTLPASLTSVCLEDLLTGEMTELSVGAQYNFYSIYEQTPAPRFMLHGSASGCVTSIDAAGQGSASGITIRSSNNNLHIYFNLSESSTGEVCVYDMLGRIVYRQATDVKNGLVDILNPIHTGGTYLVSVVTDEIAVSKKVVIGL
jgi:hypothetical protein